MAYRPDAGRCQGGLVEGHLTGQHQHRNPAGAGAGGQRADHLAVQRLVVEPALAGDDQLRGRDIVGQPGELGDDRGAGLPPPPRASSAAPRPPAAPAPVRR
jgi:hypothetical protein